MASATRIAEPARVGKWGLKVDDMTNPTEGIVVQFDNEGRAHNEPYREVARAPWSSHPEATAKWLIFDVGVDSGTAMQLVAQLLAKLASPKTASADAGFIPIP